MKKKNFIKFLKKNGWGCVDFPNRQLWYCGNVSLTISSKHNHWRVSCSSDDGLKIKRIKKLYFTPYRVIIDWGNDREWYLKY